MSERDKYNSSVPMPSDGGYMAHLEKQLTTANARIKELEGCLRQAKYPHKYGCPQGESEFEPCACGLDELLTPKEK